MGQCEQRQGVCRTGTRLQQIRVHMKLQAIDAIPIQFTVSISNLLACLLKKKPQSLSGNHMVPEGRRNHPSEEPMQWFPTATPNLFFFFILPFVYSS
jgi:hypothetical protein